MESLRAKIFIYSLILSLIGTLFTVTFMKSMKNVNCSSDNRTAAEKIGSMENSSAVTSPEAKKFIHDQMLKEQDNQEAEHAVNDPDSK